MYEQLYQVLHSVGQTVLQINNIIFLAPHSLHFQVAKAKKGQQLQ